ncbi:hypothetical protein M409DRAFT_25152 [Zasmidium cellare ATCC 36951]|uniref:Cupin type-2 domain-containing protein n=1 Tax=Zasmidium cellare ATCC 36951 TaxID=1080233 RepID=A0A6A6CB56_ZASCE|nr:uncharacterized protein M409DRAFT_25152 [Zasmidium cellare ATCC 36951]KAF2164271.1 hypothetical protein M409DRAFT_25152 [Zasmidium cellare ATCC 36951]
MSSGPPPPPNRYITTNSLLGKSTFSSLPPSLVEEADLGGAVQRLVYSSLSSPSLTKSADLEGYKSLLPKPTEYNLVRPDGGPNVWYLDVPPSSSSPMHRTVSIDFVVVVQGQIELELDEGEKRVVKAGDVVVQRSTMHAWHNRSESEWARIVTVIMQCQEVELENGRKLGLEFVG